MYLLPGGYTGIMSVNGGSVLSTNGGNNTDGGGGSGGRIAIYHSTSEHIPSYNGIINAFGYIA